MKLNLQPGRLQTPRRTQPKKNESAFGIHMIRLGKTVAVILAVAAMLIAKTHLRQRIDDTNEKIRDEQREITRTRHAIESCNIRIAERTEWSYISRQIERFDLQLRPSSGQVRALTLRDSKTNDARFLVWLKSNSKFPSMTATR